MEPDEVALSDVHIQPSPQPSGETVCSTILALHLGSKSLQDFKNSQVEKSSGSSSNISSHTNLLHGSHKKYDGNNEHKYEVYQSEFMFEEEIVENESSDENFETYRDEDGDLVVKRREKYLHTMLIEHTLSTRLKDVGHQVWLGCLLLCDYILSHQDEFEDKSVLELGAGVGMASVIAAKFAKKVICTDIGDTVLDLCSRNAEKNKSFYKHCSNKEQQDVILVRELDWLNTELRGNDKKYGWDEEDKKLLNDATVLIAADVIYDEILTDNFFDKVRTLMSQPPDKTLYLAVEKRLNFTLDEMEVACPAYTHFLQCLDILCHQGVEACTVFRASQVDLDFRQKLRFKRSTQLILWRITAINSKKN